MRPTIRPAVPADLPTIASFNREMALETENLELDPDRLLAGVGAVLADPSKGFYLLAEADGRLSGQLLLTYEWSDWRNGVFWWIQSVYVRTEDRGRGVFRALYEEALRQAEQAGNVCGVRLYVERSNSRAQRTYERLGLQRTEYEMYEVDFVLER